jgi:hemoglobin-like flavoprotein
MTTDAALVQDSFEHVKPVGDAAGLLLCERLLATAPELRKMFGERVVEQRGPIMAGITTVIERLDDPSGLATTLAKFGGWLARRGVSEEHYDVFADALLWTMSHALGHRYTPRVKAAWRNVCGQILNQMRLQSRAAA